jgi:hypothetical protein
LLGVDEPGDIGLGADLIVGLQTGDLGVDELGTPFARQRDAMMAVLDEVGTADLEDLDRRYAAFAECRPQARQPAARKAPSRPEVTVEVGAAVDRTDDALDRDLPHAEIGLTRNSEPPSRLLERDQPHDRIFHTPPGRRWSRS